MTKVIQNKGQIRNIIMRLNVKHMWV